MIFIRFNGRNDNIGDRLIFTLLYNELILYDRVFIFGSAPFEIDDRPLRIREALFKAFINKVKGNKTLLFYPPGAHVVFRAEQHKTRFRLLKDKVILSLWMLSQTKIHVVGISVGEDFKQNNYKHFSSIGVRDLSSFDLLSRVSGVVKTCPDMAFLRMPKEPKSSKNIIVSFRKATPDDGYSSRYGELLSEKVAVLISAFSNIDRKISFFSNVLEDKDFNLSLIQDNKSTNSDLAYIDELPINFDYEKFLSEYGVVVSNRLHVLLPAMSEGLLPIAVVSRNHHKIIDLFSSYGFEDFLVFVESSTDEFNATVSRIMENREFYQAEISLKLSRLREEVKGYIKGIVQGKD